MLRIWYVAVFSEIQTSSSLSPWDVNVEKKIYNGENYEACLWYSIPTAFKNHSSDGQLSGRVAFLLQFSPTQKHVVSCESASKSGWRKGSFSLINDHYKVMKSKNHLFLLAHWFVWRALVHRSTLICPRWHSIQVWVRFESLNNAEVNVDDE